VQGQTASYTLFPNPDDLKQNCYHLPMDWELLALDYTNPASVVYSSWLSISGTTITADLTAFPDLHSIVPLILKLCYQYGGLSDTCTYNSFYIMVYPAEMQDAYTTT